jgi:acyl-CoA thioesterase-1
MAVTYAPTARRPESRRSPVEIVATMGTVLTRSPGADFTRLRSGPFGRWADGVIAMRADCRLFAGHWRTHNASVVHGEGPLWVALGDSTAQGLGAPTPDGGYVGQVLATLRESSDPSWRVLNLSLSGAVIRDVRDRQLPQVPANADLVTCGVGINDILYTPPARLLSSLRGLIAAVPDGTVLLDIPHPVGMWGPLGRMSAPYVRRINSVIYESAKARRLRVARISRYFTPPWAGKFACDSFHPSWDGYTDWSRAVFEAVSA